MPHRLQVLLRRIALSVAWIDVLLFPLLTVGWALNNGLLIGAGILSLLASITTIIVLRNRWSQPIPSRT